MAKVVAQLVHLEGKMYKHFMLLHIQKHHNLWIKEIIYIISIAYFCISAGIVDLQKHHRISDCIVNNTFYN